MTVLPRFTAGGRLLALLAGLGALGLVATAVGALFSPRLALAGYLTAFCVFAGMAVGALLWLCTFHAAGSRWPVVLRRTLELLAAGLPLLALLFVPLVLGLSQLYPWALPPPEGAGAEVHHLLQHRRPFLNTPLFLVRSVLYFLLWSAVALLLLRWSVRQDVVEEGEAGGVQLLARMRKLATAALPLLALALSFAQLDWVMSLQTRWFSTVAGLLFGTGAMQAALCLLVLVAVGARGAGLYGTLLTPGHLRRLGNLLLAFVCLWAYLAYSQGMLVWVGNLPAEASWYRVRSQGGWQWVGVVLMVGRFLVPFFLLLQRRLKEEARALAALALWLLLMHVLDVAYSVLPALFPEEAVLPWPLLTALVGVGGVWGAFVLWRARGGYAVPVKDPFLLHSLNAPP